MTDYRFVCEYGKDIDPIEVRVTLTYKGREADIPIEVETIESDEEGLLEFEKLDSSSETEAVYQCRLGDRLLEDNVEFWSSVTNPIDFTVKCKPAQGAIAPGWKGTKDRKGTVKVDYPAFELHWWDERDPSRTKDPKPINVEADGEDDFWLRVACEMWLPCAPKAAPDIRARPYYDAGSHRGYDPNVVEFTHWTGKKFHPAIFGFHKDDNPRNAQPGTGNNRELTHWDSHCVLPNTRFPNHKIPLTDWIRVSTRWRGEIIQRLRGTVSHHGGRVIHTEWIHVRLRPPGIDIEVLEPKKPIPADGQKHEVTLRFRDAKTKEFLKEAELHFALDLSNDAPGGALEPESVQVEEADAGKVLLSWTPPDLEYVPEAHYDQKIRVSRGSGVSKMEEGDVVVHCNPSLTPKIEGEKCGFTWDPPLQGKELFKPGQTPAVVSIHLGAGFPVGHGLKAKEHVYDAEARATAAASTEPDFTGKTDLQGRVDWELTELHNGWAGRTDGGDTRPRIELKEFEQEPPSHFDDAATRAQTRVRTHRNHDVVKRVTKKPTNTQLDRTGKILAEQLAAWTGKEECDRAVLGSLYIAAALEGAVTIDTIQQSILKSAIDNVIQAGWDLVSALNRFERVLKKFPVIGPPLARRMKRLGEELVRGVGRFLTRLGVELAESMKKVFDEELAKYAGVPINKILEWIRKAIEAGGSKAGAEKLARELRYGMSDINEEIDLGIRDAIATIDGGRYPKDKDRIKDFHDQLAEVPRAKKKAVVDLAPLEPLIESISRTLDVLTTVAMAGVVLSGVGGAILGSPGGPAGAAAGATIMATPWVAALVWLGGAGTLTGACFSLVHAAAGLSDLAFARWMGWEYRRLVGEMVGRDS